MPMVRKNILANLLGGAWVALISIVFIPFYIHFMGMEAYGLVGFYVSLQALFALLDLGLTATLSRELARLSALHGEQHRMRDLVRTLEMAYWGIALVIMLLMYLAAPWIASDWLNVSSLSGDVVSHTLILMGLTIAMRLPYGFYGGGLLGLQRQVLLNVIRCVVETLRSGGVVLVLWWYSSDVQVFFGWQLLISMGGALVMGLALWRHLPEASGKAAFHADIFRRLWRFSAGMSLISMLAVILVQMDKIVLSRMLPLQEFAYYSLASTVAVGLYVIIAPMFSALYPRFTQYVETNRMDELVRLYHKSCQLMAVLVFPAALGIAFFSADLLQAWVRDAQVVRHAAPVLSLLVIGTAMNGLMNLPFAMQLAHGWTRLAVKLNAAMVVLLLPALLWAVHAFGLRGAASIWLVVNAAYLAIGLSLMHRRILPGELRTWLLVDIAPPAVVSALVLALFAFVLPHPFGEFGRLAWIITAVATALLLAAWNAPAIRPELSCRVHAWMEKI